MTIGSIDINGKAFLAPMAGVTDLPFRSLCKKMGAAVVYTEMISAKGLFYGGKNTEKLLATSYDEYPLAVQIFGREPQIMSEMAKALEQRGVMLIDINMGCPAPKIVKNGEGSALMREPAHIGKIIGSVSRAVNIPVTVKIRKGFDNHTINAVECAKIAEDCGASAVAVHGRTRAQQYSGEADWEIIKSVKNAVSIPVIGNGDVVSGETAEEMLNTTGCDYVMIGRAACGNPWLFKEVNHYLLTGEKIPLPSLNEKKQTIAAHAMALTELKGERIAMSEMRKHICWYVKGVRGAGRLRGVINQISDISELNKLLDCLTD